VIQGSHSWPAAFARARGRRARVLHVGNVANNAYLLAKSLIEAGVDNDVLCYGNYHFMASPEWEELDLTEGPFDPERPDWSRISHDRVARPRWFVQGPFEPCARYLEARHSRRSLAAALWWQVLQQRRQLVASGRWAAVRRWRDRARVAHRDVAAPAEETPFAQAASDTAVYAARRGWTADKLQHLFGHYDVVHAYGAEAILPCVAGTHPYVAWEHGTLRHLPFQPTPEGRLTASAYQRADAVVITNADNHAAAGRLGVSNAVFIPHIVNEARPNDASVAALREQLRQRLRADFLVLHPSRQHWSHDRHPHFEKGNDHLIRALGRLASSRPGVGAVFVEWGEMVAESRALISAVGAADRVLWIQPQAGMSLARHMGACDVMADQFHLGAFGSTLPKALWLERPSLIYLNAEAHRWCLPELPPVINARTPDDIHAGLIRAYDDRDWLAGLSRRGRQWYDQYHSSAVVTRLVLDLYARTIEAEGTIGERPNA
jgi:glycosyltransferase involved in cell wall biosynthesis